MTQLSFFFFLTQRSCFIKLQVLVGDVSCIVLYRISHSLHVYNILFC